MENDIAVYVTALEDSLQSKEQVLQNLLRLTEEQRLVLEQEQVDADAFDNLLEEKEVYIKKLEELDQGFEKLFQRIGTAIKAEKERYKAQILRMQELIRKITECSMKIQMAEKQNRELFDAFMSGKRREIRDFKVSNKTAVSYYQNMANQHHEWQSYFMDKKK